MTISELIELLEMKRDEAGEDADTNVVQVWWDIDGTLMIEGDEAG